ncbi:MAG: hypothetical protein AAF587_33310 [Bacteroidota bacterium]
MKRFLGKFFSILLQLTLMVVLPFFVLIRGSVWLYVSYEWHYGLGLLAMFGVVFFLLLIYMVMLYDWIIGKKASRTTIKIKAGIVLLLLGLFGGYTLFNLSGKHAKTEEVQKEYNALHPLLRISVGTIVLLDEGLLITDMSRAKEDYKKMGLKTLKNSLHYPQGDGWVHAMDLRTRNRTEFRNKLLQAYFWMMGFNTLRHGGTADHLHISLTYPKLPHAI